MVGNSLKSKGVRKPRDPRLKAMMGGTLRCNAALYYHVNKRSHYQTKVIIVIVKFSLPKEEFVGGGVEENKVKYKLEKVRRRIVTFRLRPGRL